MPRQDKERKRKAQYLNLSLYKFILKLIYVYKRNSITYFEDRVIAARSKFTRWLNIVVQPEQNNRDKYFYSL